MFREDFGFCSESRGSLRRGYDMKDVPIGCFMKNSKVRAVFNVCLKHRIESRFPLVYICRKKS